MASRGLLERVNILFSATRGLPHAGLAPAGEASAEGGVYSFPAAMSACYVFACRGRQCRTVVVTPSEPLIYEKIYRFLV